MTSTLTTRIIKWIFVFVAIGLWASACAVWFRSENFDLLNLVLMASFFSAFAGALLYIFRSQNGKDKYLLSFGIKLEAKVRSIDVVEWLTVNGRHPFVVVAEWTDPRSGDLHEFTSKRLWRDPSPYLAPGQAVPVYVEQGNYKKYVLDLPPETGGAAIRG
jgi:hypothetical protein